MNNNRNFTLAVAFSAVLPFALLCASAMRSGDLASLAEWRYIGMNWLFMVAPHALVVGLASVRHSFRHGLAVPSLLLLNVLLVSFQCWIWFEVPSRESGLAWMLYVPIWVSLLLGVVAYSLLRRYFATTRTTP